jgi:hypothetical protein
MDFSHFAEIPLAVWAMGAVSAVVLLACASGKYVLIALLARWVGIGNRNRRRR